MDSFGRKIADRANESVENQLERCSILKLNDFVPVLQEKIAEIQT